MPWISFEITPTVCSLDNVQNFGCAAKISGNAGFELGPLDPLPD